jgi:hypothetical protein
MERPVGDAGCPSDAELIGGGAATIASPYVPPVDHTDARSVAGCGTDDCAE